MTPIVHHNGEDTFCFVHADPYAAIIYIDYNCLGGHACHEPGNRYTPLPPGKYQLLGRADKLSITEVKSICEVNEYGRYKNYEGLPFTYDYIGNSFASLLAYKNLQPDTTYVLKQIAE